jgi:hypothetical protein
MSDVCRHPDCKTLTRHGLCKVHRRSEQPYTTISIYMQQCSEQDIDDTDVMELHTMCADLREQLGWLFCGMP